MTKNKPQPHPVKSTSDGLFNTFTGQVMDLNNPTEDLIEILDIATGLSNICRFGGQVTQFYSVAQHSVIVCSLAPPELKREALLHDAAEAYVGDVIKPLKVLIEPLYAPFEFAIQQAINQRFGLNPELLQQVKEFDLLALDIEHEAFQLRQPNRMVAQMQDAQLPFCGPGFMGRINVGWTPEWAKQYFLEAFCAYFPDQSI